MSKVIYYMPRLLTPEYNNLRKLAGDNTSIIDRTNTFELGFNTHIMSPIPTDISYIGDPQKQFEDVLMQRAKDYLDTGKLIYLFYSGGLDSTTVLLCFDQVFKEFPQYNREQLVLATTVDAMYENMDAWWTVVMQYKITNVHDVMNFMDTSREEYYLMAEGADQLFGSDKIFAFPELYDMLTSGDASVSNLNILLDRYGIAEEKDDFLFLMLESLSKAPFKIKLMREALWWFNFTLKWQSVSMRSLCFSDIFNGGSQRIAVDDMKYFSTFFVCDEVQKVAMREDFPRFGDIATTTTYKKAFRNIIIKFQPTWTEYITNKMKMGSMYNVYKHRPFHTQIITIDDNLTYISSNNGNIFDI
jgi:hypothetical protein